MHNLHTLTLGRVDGGRGYIGYDAMASKDHEEKKTLWYVSFITGTGLMNRQKKVKYEADMMQQQNVR